MKDPVIIIMAFYSNSIILHKSTYASVFHFVTNFILYKDFISPWQSLFLSLMIFNVGCCKELIWDGLWHGVGNYKKWHGKASLIVASSFVHSLSPKTLLLRPFPVLSLFWHFLIFEQLHCSSYVSPSNFHPWTNHLFFHGLSYQFLSVLDFLGKVGIRCPKRGKRKGDYTGLFEILILYLSLFYPIILGEIRHICILKVDWIIND